MARGDEPARWETGREEVLGVIIDCDRCVMQQTAACDDCVVTALVDLTVPVELGEAEDLALAALSDAGLVAPLRLVERPDGRETAAS